MTVFFFKFVLLNPPLFPSPPVAMLPLGAAVGFSDPLGISPRGGLTKRAQDGALIHQGGLQVFRPTVLVGVPKVLKTKK